MRFVSALILVALLTCTGVGAVIGLAPVLPVAADSGGD